MRKLWGRLLCRWKGKHVERRVGIHTAKYGEEPYNRICTRCRRTRLAPQRKKAAA